VALLRSARVALPFPPRPVVNAMKSLQGSFLVASPHLPDENFAKTVIFMVEHNRDGALGLVLNRVTDASLREVWRELGDRDVASEQLLYEGGPVEGPLMALHGDRDLGGIEVVPRIYFTSEKDTLEELVGRCSLDYRIFSGYAGWGPGQLEQELKYGGWLTTAARRSLVFSETHDLWRQVTHAIGDAITNDALKIKQQHRPQDPEMN